MKSAQNQQDLCNTSCLKIFSVFVLTVVKSGIKNCMLCSLVYDTEFIQFKADQSIYIFFLSALKGGAVCPCAHYLT